MCQPRTMPGSECSRNRCGCGTGFRRFFSPEEEQEGLNHYRAELRRELAVVEAVIKGLEQV